MKREKKKALAHTHAHMWKNEEAGEGGPMSHACAFLSVKTETQRRLGDRDVTEWKKKERAGTGEICMKEMMKSGFVENAQFLAMHASWEVWNSPSPRHQPPSLQEKRNHAFFYRAPLHDHWHLKKKKWERMHTERQGKAKENYCFLVRTWRFFWSM